MSDIDELKQIASNFEIRLQAIENKLLVVVKKDDSKIAILFKAIKDKIILVKIHAKEKIKSFLLGLASKI